MAGHVDLHANHHFGPMLQCLARLVDPGRVFDHPVIGVVWRG